MSSIACPVAFGGQSLVGKRVLVTAGANGIGLCITLAFLSVGAKVLVSDVDEKALRAISEELSVPVFPCDVSKEAEVKKLFSYLDTEFGGLDVLVNNAGVAGPTAAVVDMKLEDWQRTFDVNITGQFLCSQNAIPLLRKNSAASIINLSSAAGRLGFPYRAPYSASKWAVVGFTKSLALELADMNIRVNAILPGAVDGPRIRAVIKAKAEAQGVDYSELEKIYSGQSALGRFIPPEDIANMAVFLASDLARNINGQAQQVDGYTQALT